MMKFLNLFKSQVPSILKRLQDIQVEVSVARDNIKKLTEMEKEFAKQEIGSSSIGKAIDSFGVAMWLKDIGGSFLYVNKSCCETILKCSQEEVFGRKNGDFKKDALAQVCVRSDAKVLSNPRTQRWIEHAIYPDGRHVFVDTVKSPVYGEDSGEIIGVVGNAVDITASVSAEIKRKYVVASSIEIPLNLVLDRQHLEDLWNTENQKNEI